MSVPIKVFFEIRTGLGDTRSEIECTLKTMDPRCIPGIVRIFESPEHLRDFLSAANIAIDLGSLRTDVGVLVTSEQLRIFGIREDDRRRLGFVD